MENDGMGLFNEKKYITMLEGLNSVVQAALSTTLIILKRCSISTCLPMD